MNDRKLSKTATAIIKILAVLILCIRMFSDQLHDQNLLFPLVIAVFVGGFGFVGFQIFKLWKISDEEVFELEDSGQNNQPSSTTKKQPTYDDRKKYFYSILAFIAVVLFQQDQIESHILIFCGIALLIGCVVFLPAWIQKRRGKEGQPLFPRAKLQPEQIFHMLFDLFGVCFCVFFCYIVITKTPWWLAIPCLIPPLIIGGAFARPLVAGLRILLRKEKDPGEKHINKHKDADPWDRPDRKL